MKAGPEASQEYFASVDEEDFTSKLTPIHSAAGAGGDARRAALFSRLARARGE